MGERIYTASFEDISVSAVQDLLSITATANMAFELLRVEIGQRSITTWEAKPVRFRRLPATVTAGTAGAAVTPRLTNPGDPAATVTSRRNDTSQATSSGTAVTVFTRMWEFLNGFIWVATPLEVLKFAPNSACVIDLPTAPSGAMSVSMTAVIKELF